MEKNTRIYNWIFILGLILIFPVQGWTQRHRPFDDQWSNIREQAPWRIGPLYFVPRFQIQNIGYNSNVYRERVEDAPVSDYTATISPEITAHLLLGHSLILSLRENPAYVYYREQERERRWNHNFSPEFKWQLFRRFVLGGKYEYQFRRYRYSSEIDVPVNVQNKTYEGSLFFETRRDSALGVRYQKRHYSFEDVDIPGIGIPLSNRLSREEEESSGELYYQVRSDVFFFLKAGYTQYRFNEILSAWRNSDSWQGYAGLQFPLAGRLQGKVTLGYKSFLPHSENQKPFSGLAGEADLDYRMRRLRFRFNFKRDNSFSYWSNSLYFIENQIGSGVSLYLTRFLRLDYDFNHGENMYPEAEWIVSGEPVQIKRHDIYRTHTAGLTVRIYRSLGLSFNVNFWNRQTNVFYGNRQGFFAGGSLVYDF